MPASAGLGGVEDYHNWRVWRRELLAARWQIRLRGIGALKVLGID